MWSAEESGLPCANRMVSANRLTDEAHETEIYYAGIRDVTATIPENRAIPPESLAAAQ